MTKMPDRRDEDDMNMIDLPTKENHLFKSQETAPFAVNNNESHKTRFKKHFLQFLSSLFFQVCDILSPKINHKVLTLLKKVISHVIFVTCLPKMTEMTLTDLTDMTDPDIFLNP